MSCNAVKEQMKKPCDWEKASETIFGEALA
jgi:hypothetical protein